MRTDFTFSKGTQLGKFVYILVIMLLTLVFTDADCMAAGNLKTLRGKVTDQITGKGIAGVVVSDGVSCVQTDSNGKYRIKSECKPHSNIFVIVPSEYEVPFGVNKLFSGYQHIDNEHSREYNFVLKSRNGAMSEYKMLFLGDPQVMSSRPHSGVSWKWMTDKLKKYDSTLQQEHYQILLGDMVVNEIEVDGMADSFISTLAGCNINTFCIPGNHDHIYKVADYDVAISKYSEFFGPYNYAVNIGKFHYIFFDTPSSDSGITDEGWEFIRSDLSFVPMDSPVILCTHCPLTRRHGGCFSSTQLPHYQDLMNLLKGRDVSFWYGHIHFNSFWSYDEAQLEKYAPGVKSLESHVVGRGSGSWACSGEIGRDGSPRGVVEATVKDRTISWRYISFDEKYPDDMMFYVPGQFKGEGYADDNALYCNIYLWDNLWDIPEIWVDGVRYIEMTHCTSKDYDATADPFYAHLFPTWKALNIKGFRNEEPKEYDNSHLFKAVLPENVKSVEVHVTDRWGNNLVRNVSWE